MILDMDDTSDRDTSLSDWLYTIGGFAIVCVGVLGLLVLLAVYYVGLVV